jgi:molybdopterin-synthase adenylyltransferase
MTETSSWRTLAIPISRGGQEGWTVTESALRRWALSRQVGLRRAYEAALAAGVFPEVWERNFPSLSAAQQLRLWRSSVLVAGLGGLGGFLAELLARVGVGRLLLADGDQFTPANLNRQVLATRETLSLNKAQVAARHLEEINPALVIEAIPRFLDRDNLGECLPRVQVVVDGLDSIASRRLLAAAAREAGVPLVHGAVTGKFGYVSTLLPEDPQDSLARHPALAEVAGGHREVLAPTVSLVASLQVQEAIRLLLGQPPVYHRCLAYFDGDTGRLEMAPLA